MPWSIGDVEKHCKGLTDKQKKVWVSVANKALAACQKKGGKDCEKSAIMQANSVAKKTKAEQADLFLEFFDLVREEDIYNYLNIPLDFREGETVAVGRIWEEDFGLEVTEAIKNSNAVGDGEKKIMTVTFIKSGWSKNQNYWSSEIVKDLAKRLVTEAHTQYVNHLKENRTSRGRSMYEMASIALDAWTEEENGITLGKAKVEVLNGPNAFIFEYAKQNAIFGPSVDVWAKATKGKKEEKEGVVIEKIAVFFAFDYVDRVGAGGEVTSIGEQEVLNTQEESYLDKFPKFSNFVDYTYNKYKFNDYHWFLRAYLWMLMNDAEVKDKKKACKKAIMEYAELLAELDYFSLFNLEGKDEEGDMEELKLEKVEFSDINWGKICVPKLSKTAFLLTKNDKRENWHLAYKDHTGKVNKEALSALRKLIETESYKNIKLDFKIPAVIKAKILELAYLGDIPKGTDKEVDTYLKRWLYDLPSKSIN